MREVVTVRKGVVTGNIARCDVAEGDGRTEEHKGCPLQDALKVCTGSVGDVYAAKAKDNKEV